MSYDLQSRFQAILGEYFPSLLRSVDEGTDVHQAIAGGLIALEEGSLSWARLNQILHRVSEVGMSEGVFRYYFLTVPEDHPYPVESVFPGGPFRPPQDATEILSVQQLQWGVCRFFYDAMLYWGNFRQAYRDLRQNSEEELRRRFAAKRVDEAKMISRGNVEGPVHFSRDHRYLISEMACKTIQNAKSLEETQHVKLALEAFRVLRSEGQQITPVTLKDKAKSLAEGREQLDLFELMYEDAQEELASEAEVIALYSGQWEAFRSTRDAALENTRIYLSMCNDLDVYVATSMRNRQDFREMAETCERIFRSEALAKYNLRYFDPTLSAAEYHEDKGIIECLMVKMAKVLVYFSQHKESLGKVSEYAMALSLGKPVIVLCPDDVGGRQLYQFYREAHPLMRLVEFKTGTVNGAMVTYRVDDVAVLLERIFSNTMEYDLDRKPGTETYYLLKERLTASTLRVITDDKLLTETFWNNWQDIY